MKLKLKENEVVHCKTKKQAKKVLKIAHECGLKWCDGKSYTSKTFYYVYEENTCYNLNKGTYGRIREYLTDKEIISANEFLKRYKSKKATQKLIFIVGKHASGKSIKARKIASKNGEFREVCEKIDLRDFSDISTFIYDFIDNNDNSIDDMIKSNKNVIICVHKETLHLALSRFRYADYMVIDMDLKKNKKQ